MHIKRFWAQGAWVNMHIEPWLTSVMIMVQFGLGIAIIVGGEIRFSLPSYEPLIEYTHHHIWIWGLIAILSAILMGMPFRWINITGLWISMVWHIVWMACFAVAVLRYPTAAATPIVAYAGLAMIFAILLTARCIDRTKE